MKEKISITIDSEILKEIDSVVDNIRIRNRSQAIEYLAGLSLGENKTAVILAGGPEEKLRIGGGFVSNIKIKGLTLIEKQIKKLKEEGFTNIFIVARNDILTSVFSILKEGASYGVKMNYVEEKTSNGSFDSLKILKGKINANFLVVYADILFDTVHLSDLWDDHLRNNALSTIMMTTSDKPSEKGTLVVEGSNITEFTQKPKKGDNYIVFSPIFVCDDSIFEYSGESFENDIFPLLAKRGLLRGYLSSKKEVHIHSLEDVKKLR